MKTGRSNDEVAAGVDPRGENPAPLPLPTLDPPDSRRIPQPAFVEPMLATPGTAPFDGDDWLFEPKWDGYRVLAIVADGKVALRTRNRNDAGRYFPELLGPPTWLAGPEAIVDGEVVALDAEGRPDFSLLQSRLGGGFSASDLPASPDAKEAGRRAPLVFMAFDLPWFAGRSYLERAARGAQGDPPPRPPRASARPVRRTRRAGWGRVLRGGCRAGPRGRDGEAPPQPL